MELLETILTQGAVQKLGWSLIHFIWQAIAVALLLAILLRIMRRFSANLRYTTACLALGLILLSPIVTMRLISVSAPPVIVNVEPSPAHVVLPVEPTYEITMPLAETIEYEELVQPENEVTRSVVPWKQRAVERLEPALPYMVCGWLIGVFGLSVWHLGGWAQLQRLRKKMVRRVDASLQNKLKLLAERLGVNRTVQILESALVQIPTVIGWLRPVILLPASAITGLSSEQLEAILAHELAHIKRFDYLVNILQTVVEILGFYHPAVWWISHKIRAERENCCDDLAVSVCCDKINYAKALTSMEEIRGREKLAIAATGGNLFSRIRRLVGKDSSEKTFSWIPAVTVILLLVTLIISTALALTTNEEYPIAELNTNKPENEPSDIEKNSSGTKVLIETQILHVDNEFLEQVGLDADSLKNSNSWTKCRVDDANNPVMFVIDSKRKEMLLKNVDESEGSSSISRIFLMAMSGREAMIKNSNYDFKSQELGRFIKIKPQVSQDGQSTYLDCELLVRQFKNFELFSDVYINKKIDENVVSESEIFENQVNAENALLNNDHTLLILGGKVVSVRDVENRKPVLRYIPVATELFNVTPKIEGQKNEIILIKTSVVRPERNDDIDFKASFFYVAKIEKFVRIYLDLDDLEAGQYVEIKDSEKRESVLKQVDTSEIGRSGAKDFPAYAAYIDFEIRSNFDLNLSTQRFTRGSFFEHDKWDAYFVSPDTITGDGYFTPTTLCVCMWKFEIWKKLPLLDNADDIVASLVAVIIKPKNKPQEKTDVLVEEKKAAILFEMQLLSLSERTLNEIETDINPTSIANSPILDDLRTQKILQTVEADKNSKIFAKFQAIALEGKKGSIDILNLNEKYALTTSSEDELDLGISAQFTLELADNKDDVLLYLELQICLPKNLKDLKSINDRRYSKSKIETFRSRVNKRIPDRHTFLLDGGDSTFTSRRNQKNKRLLVLIKPSVLSQTEPVFGVNQIPYSIDQHDIPKVRLMQLGLALAIYADEHNEILPENLQEIASYFSNQEVHQWILEHIEYFGRGRSRQERRSDNIPIAYDRSLLQSQQGTNVLFLDAHIEFVVAKKLKKLGIKNKLNSPQRLEVVASRSKVWVPEPMFSM